MLQVYSINQAVSANGVVPFNNVVIDKGCAENLSGVGTIELNKSGYIKLLLTALHQPQLLSNSSRTALLSRKHNLRELH